MVLGKSNFVTGAGFVNHPFSRSVCGSSRHLARSNGLLGPTNDCTIRLLRARRPGPSEANFLVAGVIRGAKT